MVSKEKNEALLLTHPKCQNSSRMDKKWEGYDPWSMQTKTEKKNHTKHSQANFRTLTKKKNFIMLKITIPYHFKSLNFIGDEKVMNFQRKRDQNEDKWKKRSLRFCKVYF